ncbi:MAG: helix-turn-helix transcriptional regulator, partial [Acidimicrobiales bacterium]
LGLLKESDLHGYELKKRLVEALGPFSSVSFGSLYPALARLQRSGAVEASEAGPLAAPEAPVPPIPMTGSIAGEAAAFRARRAAATARRPDARSSRVRKVYRITERGQALFAELLTADSSSVDDTRAFHLKLAFCRYLAPEARLGLLERRRAQLAERLARFRSSGRGRRDRMDTYMRSLMEHDTEATERDISWLDSLIASEKQSAAAPAAPHKETGRP